MINTPTIETERLILRKFTLDDAEAFFAIMSDGEANEFLPWLPLSTVEEARSLLQEKYLNRYKEPIGFWYAICLKTDDIPIGYINVGNSESHDFGYGLRKEHWGKGIATEASERVIQQLKESGIPYITATHDTNNPKSGNVLKKIGMTYFYSYEEQWQPKNILVTFRMYQLNFDGQNDRVYRKYWDKYDVHFIEENINNS